MDRHERATSLYKYENLAGNTAFRILELQPGEFDDPICCRMKLGLLNDGQKYEALSYAWGDSHLIHAVKLDGLLSHVSMNLYRALRTIRDRTREVAVWADQLCINQTDAREREHQVCIMGTIFAHAERVSVFVEDYTAGDGSAVKSLVHQMKQKINQQLAEYHYIHAIPPVGPEEIPDYELLGWESFKHLANSSWGSRTWIR